MVFNEREDLAGVLIREPETAADFCAHGDSHFDVTVEADAVRRDAEGRRFAYVVQQRAPSEGEWAVGRKLFEKEQGMDPDVAFGMKLRRLRDAFHARDLGQNLSEEAGFIQQFESVTGMAFGEHFGEFVADSFAADGLNARGESADGRKCYRLDFKPEARGEADCAQQAELILLEAAAWLANGADYTRLQVGQTAHVVDQSFADGGGWFEQPRRIVGPTQWIQE